LIFSVKWLKSKPANLDEETAIIHYRGVYILNKNFNVAFGAVVIPLTKLFLTIVFVFTFFVIVRLWSLLNALSFTMMVILNVSSGCLLLPTSIIMSSLYDASAQFQKNMLPSIQLIPDRMARMHIDRQLKSCSVIRCHVGSLYYMEAKAKLTLLQHVINGVVFYWSTSKYKLTRLLLLSI